MSKKKKAPEKTISSKEQISEKAPSNQEGLSNKMLLLLTFGLAIIYFVFSTFSNGFYMHDEVGNFMNSKNLWYDDLMRIFGANTKTGYRILYAIPAMGGFTFMKFFNALVAAFTVYFSYKLLDKLGSKHKLLVFFILGLQPLWFMLSFRNYSEMTIAFLLVIGALQFFNKKYIWSALILSYIAFTRSEYHMISGLLFLVLLFKKEWLAAILTGTFTVLQNFIGYFLSGDILYLPHAMMEYSERIKDVWPKQGFDHYFLMSNVIFGAAALTLLVAYIAILAVKKKKPNWYLLVPVLLIFFVNCAFNAKSIDFGPGNGGNLRYLIIIAPLITILGVRAIDEISEFNKRYLIALFLVPFIMAVGIYQTYEHNFIKFTEVEDYNPLIFSAIASVLLLLPLKRNHYYLSFGLLSVIIAVSSITTRKIQPEERSVKKAAKWYEKQVRQGQLFSEDNKIVCAHSLFYFYLGKTKNEFKKEPDNNLVKEVTDELQKGDLVIWESHYGYRPKLRPTSQPYEFYDKNPNFSKIQFYQSSDRRFSIVFFQKVSD